MARGADLEGDMGCSEHPSEAITQAITCLRNGSVRPRKEEMNCPCCHGTKPSGGSPTRPLLHPCPPAEWKSGLRRKEEAEAQAWMQHNFNESTGEKEVAAREPPEQPLRGAGAPAGCPPACPAEGRRPTGPCSAATGREQQQRHERERGGGKKEAMARSSEENGPNLYLLTSTMV